MKKRFKSKEGITLIALVVTIIVLIILAGVSISLVLGDNGIVTKAKQAKGQYSQAQAREKLEMVLAELQTDKAIRERYSQDSIDTKLQENDMEVEGDIVIVDGWQFEIDRDIPAIVDELGQLTEEDRLKPIITKASIKPEKTQIEVSIQLRNEEGRKISYVIKKKETGETIEETGIIDNLTYTFTGLEQGIEYEIIITATNSYGTSTKTIKGATLALVTGITLNETALQMKINESKKIAYTIEPENATNKSLSWTSSDTNIVTVKDGIITAIGNGEATIRISSLDGSNISTELQVVIGDFCWLIKNGNDFSSLTGGWVKAGAVAWEYSYRFENDYFYIYGGTNHMITVSSKNKIDFSKYSKMYIDFEGGTSYGFFDESWYDGDNNWSSMTWISNATRNVCTYDISNISEEKYLHFRCSDAAIKIYNIWLEE